MILTSERRSDLENNLIGFLILLINPVSMKAANTSPRRSNRILVPWQCSDFKGHMGRLKGSISQQTQWFLLSFYTMPWCVITWVKGSAYFTRMGDVCTPATLRAPNTRKGLGERLQVRPRLSGKRHPLVVSTSHMHVVKCTERAQQSSCS